MRSFIFLLLVTVISGCANSGKISKLKLGMTHEQVVRVLGQPVSISSQVDSKLLNYKLSETNNDAIRGLTTPYYVRLINDRVDSYGRTEDLKGIQKTPAVTIEKNEECLQKPIVRIEKEKVKQAKTEVKREPELHTELKKLKELRDNGVLTEEEYQKRRKEILVTQLGTNFINLFPLN